MDRILMELALQHHRALQARANWLSAHGFFQKPTRRAAWRWTAPLAALVHLFQPKPATPDACCTVNA